jgi:hypothetical protein
VSLVSTEELALYLGLEFSDTQEERAQLLLDLVSGEVESYCNAVALQRMEEDTVVVRGSWSNIITAPGAPVHEVIHVFVDGEEVTDFDYTRHGLLISPERWGGPHAAVTIVYDHGLDEVPQVVKSVVLSRAVRAFTNPEGLMQAKLGADQSFSYAADAEMVTGLNKSERMLLKRYRRTVG